MGILVDLKMFSESSPGSCQGESGAKWLKCGPWTPSGLGSSFWFSL